MGENTVIGQNALVGRNVKIGKSCKIQNNVSLFDGEYDKEVFIGPSVVFTNVINPEALLREKMNLLTKLNKEHQLVLMQQLFVAIKLAIFFIGGSVVNRDIKDFELVVGNPIRNIGWISKEGVKLNFEKQIELH